MKAHHIVELLIAFVVCVILGMTQMAMANRVDMKDPDNARAVERGSKFTLALMNGGWGEADKYSAGSLRMNYGWMTPVEFFGGGDPRLGDKIQVAVNRDQAKIVGGEIWLPVDVSRAANREKTIVRTYVCVDRAVGVVTNRHIED